MLKIWLTWLQPSLGVFGIALLLSAPLASTAAPKPTGTATVKTSKQQQIKIAPVPAVNPVLNLSGVSMTPDFAVRQLALDTMAKSVAKAESVAVQSPGFNSNDALASFVSPAERLPNVSAKATKTVPQVVKHSVAAAVATKPTQPKVAAPLVPGLFIGTSEVRLSSKFLPKAQPQPNFGTSKLVASVTPTAAMFSAAIAEPFPVVLPRQMSALRLNPGIENVPILQAKSSATDPIASIPAGLQSLLGNEPAIQTAVKTTPVAKVTANKTSSLVALGQLITPETVAPTVARGASLQLTTAQVYAGVPKFDIPGASVSNSTPIAQIQTAKPTTSVMAVKPVRRDLAKAVTERKGNYVALMSDSFLVPVQHHWTTTRRGNSLGGLILGSQPQAGANSVALLTTSMPKNLTVFSSARVN